MADTGAPWFIPFVEPTDIPRSYPQDSEDLADAIAAGLSAAGGLVAVKHVLKTDTFSASVAAGGNVAVDDLEIIHEVADENNRLIITAYFGLAANDSGLGNCAIAVAENGTLLAVGDADGTRTRVGAGGVVAADFFLQVTARPSVTFVHTPGAGSKTYTVRAMNPDANTRTLFVNRSQRDAAVDRDPRGASSLVIQEVKV